MQLRTELLPVRTVISSAKISDLVQQKPLPGIQASLLHRFLLQNCLTDPSNYPRQPSGSKRCSKGKFIIRKTTWKWGKVCRI